MPAPVAQGRGFPLEPAEALEVPEDAICSFLAASEGSANEILQAMRFGLFANSLTVFRGFKLIDSSYGKIFWLCLQRPTSCTNAIANPN